MADSTTITPEASLSAFWKTRYQRQNLLIGSITSLLNRYGGILDLESLQSAFVLTMMGHYVVSEACYYAADDSNNEIRPSLAYGRISVKDLPRISRESQFVKQLTANPYPTSSITLAPFVASDSEALSLCENYRTVAPLHLNARLVGVLLLGDRISGSSLNEFDFEVMAALCAISATTFNNAILYHNARCTAAEIQKLYELRTEVISRISHEFRTPLTVIKAGLEGVLRGDNLDSWSEPLLSSSTRLEGLIDSLLELNQNEADQQNASCDPIRAVQKSVHEMATTAGDRRVTFNVQHQRDIDGCIATISRSDLIVATRALLDKRHQVYAAER